MLGYKVLPALVFCGALILGSGVVYLVHSRESLRHTQEVDLIFSDSVAPLNHRLRQAMTTLASTSAFVASRDTRFMPRDRFAGYIAELKRLHLMDGIHGIGVTERLPPSQLPEAWAQMAEDYAQPPPQGPSDRPVAPVLLYEPLTPEAAALIGMDMLPTHGAYLEKSLEVQDFAISPPLPDPLSQRPQAQTVWIYLSTPNPTPSAPDRFLFMQLKLPELIASLAAPPAQPLALRIRDEDKVLYTSPTFESQDSAQTERITRSIAIGGREWQIEGSVPLRQGPLGPWSATKLTAFISLLIAIALALMTRSILLERRSQRSVVEAQYANIKAQDMHLREMSHRLKNVLTRVIAIARQTARSTSEKADFLATLDQRLRAMAQAQDMLTLSAREAVDLERLVEAEVRQIYGETVKEFQMSGERIILGPEQIQPLGLAIHELATNTLKYGAASQPEGSLQIEWHRVESPAGPMIHLEWRERFTPAVQDAPPRAGFGTHLIDNCIKADLGGQITRTFHEKGLDVVISLPLHKPRRSKRHAKRKARSRKS